MTTETDKFDRIRGALDGLPGTRKTRPSTVVESMPIVGNTTTYVVETLRMEDARLICFLQIVDSDGRARLVLPDKVVSAIASQRERLFDRSTPESRKRADRSRELARKRTADHGKGRHATRPVQSCPECRKAAGVATTAPRRRRSA